MNTPHLSSTVFIVDDDEAVRDSLRWLLEANGYRVRAYASGESFLEDYDASQIGVLIADVRMPGMSGLELQDTLARAGSLLAVVVITGHADVPMAARAFRAGAVDVIEKPFNDQMLLDRVHEGLEKSTRAWGEWTRKASVRSLLARLTPRERQVADLVVAGKPNKVIAAEINLSLKTVEVHRHNAMEKLEVGSIADLIRLLLEAE